MFGSVSHTQLSKPACLGREGPIRFRGVGNPLVSSDKYYLDLTKSKMDDTLKAPLSLPLLANVSTSTDPIQFDKIDNLYHLALHMQQCIAQAIESGAWLFPVLC
jgi:hypothetical protein